MFFTIFYSHGWFSYLSNIISVPPVFLPICFTKSLEFVPGHIPGILCVSEFGIHIGYRLFRYDFWLHWSMRINNISNWWGTKPSYIVMLDCCELQTYHDEMTSMNAVLLCWFFIDSFIYSGLDNMARYLIPPIHNKHIIIDTPNLCRIMKAIGKCLWLPQDSSKLPLLAYSSNSSSLCSWRSQDSCNHKAMETLRQMGHFFSKYTFAVPKSVRCECNILYETGLMQ